MILKKEEVLGLLATVKTLIQDPQLSHILGTAMENIQSAEPSDINTVYVVAHLLNETAAATRIATIAECKRIVSDATTA